MKGTRMTDIDGGARGDRRRLFGKYRGIVVDNVDPLFSGRIIVDVPAAPDARSGWAMPCLPYAGKDVGFFALPPIGANVWVEFEGGDPNYPIWAGCFWGEGEALRMPVPEMKVFKTECFTMIVNDVAEEGGLRLECNPPAVDMPLSMTFDSTGITIVCRDSSLQITPENILLSAPPAELQIMSETIVMKVPDSTMWMSGDAVEIASGTIRLSGQTSLDPAVTVEGDSNFAGNVSVDGTTNVAGPLNVEGGARLRGGVAIEGEVAVDGAPIR
jgi:hypothetical protein